MSGIYREIFRLADMMDRGGYPYQIKKCFDGWQILVFNNSNHADFIEHYGSYGHEADLLESYGFEEDMGDVRGWLNAEEAFESVKNFFNN